VFSLPSSVLDLLEVRERIDDGGPGRWAGSVFCCFSVFSASILVPPTLGDWRGGSVAISSVPLGDSDTARVKVNKERETFPKLMAVSHYTCVPRFPRSRNRKLNRHSLLPRDVSTRLYNLLIIRIFLLSLLFGWSLRIAIDSLSSVLGFLGSLLLFQFFQHWIACI
jgi:hypothetical protein